jgi:hypothetical protein
MNFFAKLAALNPLLVYLLMVIVFLGFSLVLFSATRRLTAYEMRRTHNDITGFIFTTVGAIYAVLLAFITVIVWEQYNGAAENAAKESTTALAMYRNLSLYPEQEQAKKATQSLLVFIRSVVNDEYPAMAQMKNSRSTASALDSLWENSRQIKPQNFQEQVLFAEILKDLNTIAGLRAERLAAATGYKFSGILRIILLFGAIITLVLAIFFGAENFYWHIILNSLLAILIASILFVALQLAHPFSSGIAIQPDGYNNVLELIPPGALRPTTLR